MYAAASGMAAQQQNLDIVADNLANADVAGFKAAQATFAAIGGNAQLGTAATGVREIFAQGRLLKSGGPFDVAIDGAGFFTVTREGERAYTRAGSFSRAADGSLRNPDGWTLAACAYRCVPATSRSLPTAASRSRSTVGRASRPVAFD